MGQKKPLVVLTGPTAVGKTGLSIGLAKAIGGEIISADSMQVYKYMDIGSAKIKKEEMGGVPHHLIDILEPSRTFNVVTFQSLCRQAMESIYANDRIPILTGGTGFYIQSVLYDIDFTENEEDTAYRDMLAALAQKEGAQYLHDMLKNADPKAAEAIHPNNIKRVIRALEFNRQTGMYISEHNETERHKESPYASAYFVLNDDRQKLYAQIEKRVDDMLAAGLVEEVRRLKDMGCKKDMVSMQGLGYKEIFSFLDGECGLEDAVYRIKRDTRHFAKRQLTWFKREKNVIWVNKPDFGYDNERMLVFMQQKINEAVGTA